MPGSDSAPPPPLPPPSAATIREHAAAVLAQVESGALDELVSALHKRQRRIQWGRLPSKIILLRHGQSEGNVDHNIYATKGDSRLEVRQWRPPRTTPATNPATKPDPRPPPRAFRDTVPTTNALRVHSSPRRGSSRHGWRESAWPRW